MYWLRAWEHVFHFVWVHSHACACVCACVCGHELYTAWVFVFLCPFLWAILFNTSGPQMETLFLPPQCLVNIAQSVSLLQWRFPRWELHNVAASASSHSPSIEPITGAGPAALHANPFLASCEGENVFMQQTWKRVCSGRNNQLLQP